MMHIAIDLHNTYISLVTLMLPPPQNKSDSSPSLNHLGTCPLELLDEDVFLDWEAGFLLLCDGVDVSDEEAEDPEDGPGWLNDEEEGPTDVASDDEDDGL